MFWRRSPKKVLVLGCGPAGLFAAHAATQLGYQTTILSRKRISDMYGAQYLHRPIPGLREIPLTVDYRLQGTVEEYRAKVYGAGYPGEVSPQTLSGIHAAWDIRAAYLDAWQTYEPNILGVPDITASWVERIEFRHYRLVVLALPAPAVCRTISDTRGFAHAFETKQVYAIGDAPQRGIYAPKWAPEDTVVCNGWTSPSWYRAAQIAGYCTVEWPAAKKPPIRDVTLISKPMHTTCNCWMSGKLDGKVVRVGRYGTWTKGVLSHEAYQTVRKILEENP